MYQTLLFLIAFVCYHKGYASPIHNAPIILKAEDLPASVQRYPLQLYRLFKNNGFGVAEPIPFQIDELNHFGDFILPIGKENNQHESNGIFDALDELSYMGEDVGLSQEPKNWPQGKPAIVHEITHSLGSKKGSVYLGIFFANPSPPSNRRYVVFNPQLNLVSTSRYEYHFDPSNYLTVKGVDMKRSQKKIPMIDSSTFYLRADLKYFITLTINQNSIQSYLESHKAGPIRTIVRVNFFYRVLRMNFELGMFTEVSLFSNAVFLPAIMHSPIDGKRRLNANSGFYYGFNTIDNPNDLNLSTNMPVHKGSEALSTQVMNYFWGKGSAADKAAKEQGLYWLSLHRDDRFLYFEVEPSKELKAAGHAPELYRENVAATAQPDSRRKNKNPLPLGQSPVNLGLYFDLSQFSQGDHKIGFRLYFENNFVPDMLESYRSLPLWQTNIRRL
jgi:hypothetical protein